MYEMHIDKLSNTENNLFYIRNKINEVIDKLLMIYNSLSIQEHLQISNELKVLYKSFIDKLQSEGTNVG
jgi:hypothetical protein